MLFVARDAREAQRRSEDQSNKTVQRGDKLSVELETLRAQLVEVQSTHQRTVEPQTAFAAEAGQLRIERDNLKEKLANTTGQLQAMSKQVEALSRHVGQARKAPPTGRRSSPSATNNTKNEITPGKTKELST